MTVSTSIINPDDREGNKTVLLGNDLHVSEYRLNRTLVTEVQFELDFDSKDFEDFLI